MFSGIAESLILSVFSPEFLQKLLARLIGEDYARMVALAITQAEELIKGFKKGGDRKEFVIKSINSFLAKQQRLPFWLRIWSPETRNMIIEKTVEIVFEVLTKKGIINTK